MERRWWEAMAMSGAMMGCPGAIELLLQAMAADASVPYESGPRWLAAERFREWWERRRSTRSARVAAG